ncbi:MAG: hypothetical protein DRZ76_04565 [Candidatus Nealsonbacteria bacterium]|nr:MAG: hypothetical protein DRZ76_04565 [Candidatus Nealsonbacteria bacterium]
MKIQFIASLPPIQSAIKLDGNGDGGRIQLDVPRNNVEALIKLQGLAGKILKVVVEEASEIDFIYQGGE